MVIHCTGIALQFSLSLHTVRAPFSWTHQSACVKLLAKKNPEDQDSLFFSSKTCFRALAVAFALSNYEWLRLFTPCCLLLLRNLRLQETGCSPARILQESSFRCSFVLKVFYKRGWSGQRKEWRANQWRKKTEERMVASPTHDRKSLMGYRCSSFPIASRNKLTNFNSYGGSHIGPYIATFDPCTYVCIYIYICAHLYITYIHEYNI